MMVTIGFGGKSPHKLNCYSKAQKNDAVILRSTAAYTYFIVLTSTNPFASLALVRPLGTDGNKRRVGKLERHPHATLVVMHIIGNFFAREAFSLLMVTFANHVVTPMHDFCAIFTIPSRSLTRRSIGQRSRCSKVYKAKFSTVKR